MISLSNNLSLRYIAVKVSDQMKTFLRNCVSAFLEILFQEPKNSLQVCRFSEIIGTSFKIVTSGPFAPVGPLLTSLVSSYIGTAQLLWSLVLLMRI